MLKLIFVLIGTSPVKHDEDVNQDDGALTRQLSHNDLPGLSAMFNRQKYYNKLVHPSDNRMV